MNYYELGENGTRRMSPESHQRQKTTAGKAGRARAKAKVRGDKEQTDEKEHDNKKQKKQRRGRIRSDR